MKKILIFLFASVLFAQPKFENGYVVFTIYAPDAKKVAVAGDFNGWSKNDFLTKDEKGFWSGKFKIKPGLYQYKFIVDDKWMTDPENPVKVENFNRTDYNSVFVLSYDWKILLQSVPDAKSNPDDVYPKTNKIYLNIIWHQHQPSYIDPERDELRGPWVRTHGTKDYYDMASILEKYPDVHVTINLTSSLLLQIEEYYVKRLKRYVDLKKNRVDAKRYFKDGVKIDPWIDLMLKNSEEFTEVDFGYLYKNPWNCFSVSEVVLDRFPEYKALKEKNPNEYSISDIRKIKFFFYLANFDPDFLNGKINLPNGLTVDLTDLIERREGKYYLKREITEDDCNRIVAETFKVMSSIIPIHKKLMYDPKTKKGQIEVITTPFYHPILPLIYDSDIARISQPFDKLPKRFNYPEDAYMQVKKSIEYYQKIFGRKPLGMWPAEGAVSEQVISVFVKNGVKWIATDEKVLSKSAGGALPFYFPYRVDEDTIKGNKNENGSLLIVFRDTHLSDAIGFVYQNYDPEVAADDFIRYVLSFAPKDSSEERLISVILDGENAWEWYRKDEDGKGFLNALYRKLSKLYKDGQIVTVTMSEWIYGNPKRGIKPHPIVEHIEIEPLWAGSWINANFDTWVGEEEENLAWEYLLHVRRDMEKLKVEFPRDFESPKLGTKRYYELKAWESIFSAEGSDWFWWYGEDQTGLGGDEPFDEGFRTHLINVYKFLQKAGYKVEIPEFLNNSILRLK
jgi:alpha-amylase/alpha-mannosidase (GH57 family)